MISNCVVNLSAEKLAVLNGVRRLLKRGGEFFFADVYADPRLVGERPLAISDPELAARTGAICFFSATSGCSPSPNWRTPARTTARR